MCSRWYVFSPLFDSKYFSLPLVPIFWLQAWFAICAFWPLLSQANETTPVNSVTSGSVGSSSNSDTGPNFNTSPSDNQEDQWKSLAAPALPEGSVASPGMPAGNNSPTDISNQEKLSPGKKKDPYGPQTGWGLRSSAGVAIQQSMSASLQYGTGHQDVYFQPGIRFDIEAFYNITNGFYFGLESAFIYNEISSVLRTEGGQTRSYVSGDSDLGYAAFYQVPVLLNIRFQIPNSGRFRGFCTGGFGGVWDFLTASSSESTLSQNQWNYAFQLGAGFQYNLMPGLDLDTAFKTFITPNPLLFSDGTSQVKTSYNYTIEIGLAYRF